MTTYEKQENGQIKASIEVLSYEEKVYPNIEAIKQEHIILSSQIEDLENKLSSLEKRRDDHEDFLVRNGILEEAEPSTDDSESVDGDEEFE